MLNVIRHGFVGSLVGLVVLLPLAAIAADSTKPAANPGSSKAGTAQQASDPAAADAARRAAFIKTGRRVAEFCANCHGENGTSKMAEVPNLAGQNVTYIFEQMRKYAGGERTDDTGFMRGLIKVLSEEEKSAVALFFSQSTPIPARAAPGVHAERGKKVYVERCVQCHGEQGHGAEIIPHLAGQQTDYLKTSLERYRKNTGARIFLPMSQVIQDLSDEDVMALVDYLSSMR